MKVWVAFYNHNHGQDVSVYSTPDLAEQARQSIAENYWDQDMSKDTEKPSDRKAMADAYFDYMDHIDGDYYIVLEKTVEVDPSC